jgi:hypothetical protein
MTWRAVSASPLARHVTKRIVNPHFFTQMPSYDVARAMSARPEDAEPAGGVENVHYTAGPPRRVRGAESDMLWSFVEGLVLAEVPAVGLDRCCSPRHMMTVYSGPEAPSRVR